jgi:hypothetical protein
LDIAVFSVPRPSGIGSGRFGHGASSAQTTPLKEGGQNGT